MTFRDEIDSVIPSDVPHRDALTERASRLLELIVEANRTFNLTRITGPREAAIKHVLDSVLPWRHFTGEREVLDAGAGAGLPGIPLALILPETRFLLVESVGKKARFLASAVGALSLPNVEVIGARAEDICRDRRPDLIIARALAPLSKFCSLFGKAVRAGSRALLYKGPDATAEIAEAAPEARKQHLELQVVQRYNLPDGAGERCLVSVKRSPGAPTGRTHRST